MKSSSEISPPASSSNSLKRISALSAVSIFFVERKIKIESIRVQGSPFHCHPGCRGSQLPPPSPPVITSLASISCFFTFSKIYLSRPHRTFGRPISTEMYIHFNKLRRCLFVRCTFPTPLTLLTNSAFFASETNHGRPRYSQLQPLLYSWCYMHL